MTKPITGPFSTTRDIPGLYFNQRKYRQRSPYDLRLPYYVRSTKSNNPHGSVAAYAVEPTQNELRLVKNKAYDRFFSKIRAGADQAGWGMTLMEHQKLRQRFNRDAINVANWFEMLARDWERRYKRRFNRREAKSLASLILEMRFQWIPLVKDMYTTMELLGKPCNSGRISATATGTYKFRAFSTGDWSVRADFLGNIRCRMIADVEISNPNLYTMNQLGIVNPAVLAHDRIPWFHIVDWWVNFGQMAASLTDTYGLSLSNATTSVKIENAGNWGYYRPMYNPPLVDYYRYETQQLNRQLGIDGPKIAIKPFQGLSLIRGVTAIAHVVQLLPAKP